MTGKNEEGRAPGGVVRPVELLADVAPTPSDAPTAYSSPAPGEAVYRLEDAGGHLAEAAALSAAADGATTLANARGRARPAAAAMATKELEFLVTVLSTAYRGLHLLDKIL